MANDKKYIIRFNKQGCVELSKPINTILLYRIPYKNIKARNHGVDISNRFIVYILYGRNAKGKDIIYVGKSKNGIDYRPTAHEDKNENWTMCYVLTDIKERTILNDGTIQYLEDRICNRVNAIDKYINTTTQTTSGTANHSDMEDCDEFLEEAYDMLFTLGLDLYEEDSDNDSSQGKDEPTVMHSDIPVSLIPLFDSFTKLVKEVDSGIEVEQRVHYWKYALNGRVVCTISKRATRLLVCFNISAGKMIDPNNILEDCSTKGHSGLGNYLCSFSNEEHFDDFRDFIKQTIDDQKSLKERRTDDAS
ncbi:MAG: hypothetical protein IJH71_08055 [Eubacterium sp.]|nr:hypothetical protein [Eubacterium sp.]